MPRQTADLVRVCLQKLGYLQFKRAITAVTELAATARRALI